MNRKIILNLAVEFGPLVFFVGANALYGFFPAVFALVMGTFLAFVTNIALQKRVPALPLITTTGAIIFGGSTLLFQEPFFIKAGDTIYYSITGLVVLVSYFKRKPILKYLFDHMFAITDEGWNTLSVRWGIQLLLLAVLNTLAWVLLSSSGWAYYKSVAQTYNLLFLIYQIKLVRETRLPYASNRFGFRIRKKKK